MIAVYRKRGGTLKRVWRNTVAELKEALELAFSGLQWPIFKPELASTIVAMLTGFGLGIPGGHMLSHEPWPLGTIACLGALAAGTGAFRYFDKARPSWTWLIDIGLGLWVLGLAMTLAWLATN